MWDRLVFLKSINPSNSFDPFSKAERKSSSRMEEDKGNELNCEDPVPEAHRKHHIHKKYDIW